MSFARLSFIVVLVFPLSWCANARLADAQQTALPSPAGVVSGVITFGDTQRPARFASVTLAPVSPPKPKLPKVSDKAMEDNPAEAMKALGSLMGSMTMLQAQTGLDGGYTVEGVPPGDYYVSASAPGYVSGVLRVLQSKGDAQALKARLAALPVVHVEAGHTVRNDVSLERGAAVSGVVTYDDGSPAPMVVVKLEEIEAEKAKEEDDDSMLALMPLVMAAGGAATGSIMATTDDRGRFRMAGIAPGEYRVAAAIAANKGFSMRNGAMDMGALSTRPLEFYAPATLHKKEASALKLKAGEERTDVDVRADLTAMHSVSGRVASAVDHHALNAGMVTLVDATDKEFKRTATVDAAGSYTVHYVPSGTYTLTVSGGADKEPSKKAAGPALLRFAAMTTVKSYEEASQPLIVSASDAVGVDVECAESKTVKKDMDLIELMKSLKE